MSLMSSLLDWLKKGYPAGVPEAEYVPLLALLGRRLTQDEILELSQQLRKSGLAPATRVDIGVGISRITSELPAPSEIDRVANHLQRVGYPISDAEFQSAWEDKRNVPGGYTIRRVRPARALDVGAVYELLQATKHHDDFDFARIDHFLRRTHRAITAWDITGRLVGIQRSLSDGETIAYLCDTVVHPDTDVPAISCALIERMLTEYESLPVNIEVDSRTQEEQKLLTSKGFVPSAVAHRTLWIRPVEN